MTLCRLTLSTAVAAFSLIAASAATAGPFPKFEENCGTAPFAPDIKFDATIADDKVAELRKDVLAFMKASDQFQECIGKILDAGPDFDKKKDDTAEKRIAVAKRYEREAAKIIEDNQSEKERVGADFNKLIEMRKKPAPK